MRAKLLHIITYGLITFLKNLDSDNKIKSTLLRNMITSQSVVTSDLSTFSMRGFCIFYSISTIIYRVTHLVVAKSKFEY